MRVFVTGASGFVGSALVPRLQQGGHDLVGLARSTAAADRLTRVGVQPLRGDLDDLDALRRGAEDADAVVHLAFGHDFTRYQQAGETDVRAVEAMAAALAGSGRPLLVTSGTGVLPPGRVGTEDDAADPGSAAAPRVAGERAALAAADRGVRSVVVRLPPSVHSRRKKGFVARLVDVARERGVSGYVADGANRWPAVHVLDAAELFALALERAAPGSVLHGVAEEAVAVRELAELVGRRLGLPTASVPAADAAAHFGWLAFMVGADVPASSGRTRERLGWQPVQASLLDDLANGAYFEQEARA